MENILKLLLNKRGIENIEDLSEEERKDFDRYNIILSTPEVTVPQIRTFCEVRIKEIEGQWRNLDNSTLKNERLITMHNVYSRILEAIDAPQEAKKQLELYLQGVIKDG